MQEQAIPWWAKLVLIAAMVIGSDPTSEPVINRLANFNIGCQANWAMAQR